MTKRALPALSKFAFAVAVFACFAAVSPASAKMLSGKALVNALTHGGYVLVMRHASSPMAKPSKATADPGNTGLERQLDQAGRNAATAMGKAFTALHIPVDNVVSSPTYRALETVRLADLGRPMTFEELGEGAKGMKAQIGKKQVEFLRRRTEEKPPTGTNTVVVTHTPNIKATFGKEAAGIKAGEALIFKPDGKGHTTFVARVPIDEWPKLGAQD